MRSGRLFIRCALIFTFNSRISFSSTSDTSPLLAVRKVAEYFAESQKREALVKYFDDLIAKGENLDEIWIIAAATVYYNQGNYESALKVLHGGDGLETKALHIQTLLQIHRPDVAKKVFVQMQEKDDDATLTQLAQAWLNIEIGGEKLQDAYYVFQDFADKFSASIQLLNSQAVCNVGLGKFNDAADVLRDCLERSPNDYDTLVNLVAVSQHTERPNEVQHRYLSTLKDAHPQSTLVQELQKKEADFDRLCLQYQPTNSTPIVY